MTRWPRMMRAIVTSATLIAAAYTLDHLFTIVEVHNHPSNAGLEVEIVLEWK